jgi:hypothetical protein
MKSLTDAQCNEILQPLLDKYEGTLIEWGRKGRNRIYAKIKCKCGNIWEPYLYALKDGKWCGACAGNEQLNLEECNQFATLKGGKCLSTEYVNKKSCLRWECNKGHIWNTIFGSIKHQGTWCPECYGNKKLTIDKCIDHATTKGGKCLSTKYVNNRTYIDWKYQKGHTFSSYFDNVKNQNQWCPRCSNYRSEELTREIFERLTGHVWKKIRPPWLERLELDGYCEELKTAFEYQGTQHVKHFPHFHTEQQFEEQCCRDILKQLICADRGIRLIAIPHTYDFRRPDELEKFIRESIIKD